MLVLVSVKRECHMNAPITPKALETNTIMSEERLPAMEKRVAPSAERNKDPILNQLRKLLKQGDRVLEIGSGTGQHACYFTAAMPEISWQPTELAGGLEQIQLWMAEQVAENLLPPIELHVGQKVWPVDEFDFVYTCNTLHIMPEEAVEILFSRLNEVLVDGGRFCAYGPFSFDGRHTAASNASFDAMLREDNSGQGVRDMAWLDALANTHGLASADTIDMPSNNFLALWRCPAD